MQADFGNEQAPALAVQPDSLATIYVSVLIPLPLTDCVWKCLVSSDLVRSRIPHLLSLPPLAVQTQREQQLL